MQQFSNNAAFALGGAMVIVIHKSSFVAAAQARLMNQQQI
jgi:hypothetical protein